MAVVVREPLVGRTPARAVPQQYQQVNLLGTTLKPATGTPFRAMDWPNPVRAKRFIQDTNHRNLNETTLPTDLGTFYFLNDSGMSSFVVKRQKPQEFPNLLITTLAPVAPPFRQTEWPNPVRIRYVNKFDQRNGVLQLLTFVAPSMPFSQLNWPNPQPQKLAPERLNTSLGINPYFLTPPVVSIQEIIPYLIGAEEYSARVMLEAIHMVVVVIGSGGTVTAQSVAAFTLADRGTTVEITMGGATYIPPRAGRGGNPPYGSSIQ